MIRPSFVHRILSYIVVAIAFASLISCATGTPNTPMPVDFDVLRTNVSEDWDHWRCELEDNDGRFRTNTSEDWDNWRYELEGSSGQIKTNVSEDWDNWVVDNGAVRIRTNVSEDWDYWQLTGDGMTIRMRTNVSEDWDYWLVSGEVSGRIRTFSSEDWDRWDVDVEWESLPTSMKAAVLFIPIFTSSLYVRGVCD